MERGRAIETAKRPAVGRAADEVLAINRFNILVADMVELMVVTEGRRREPIRRNHFRTSRSLCSGATLAAAATDDGVQG